MPDESVVDKYFKKFGGKYTKEAISEAISYLSYKHPSEMPKTESATEPTLYIFRHGQSEDNAEFLFSGWRDAKLTDLGIKQAEVLADKLKDKNIQLLVSSPQTRAIDTMKIAMSKNKSAQGLRINTDKRIMERSYGKLQGQSKLEMILNDKYSAERVRRSYDFVPERGESLEMVCKRVASFCEEIVKLMRETQINVAVSCHGNSIRGFRKYFENIDNDTLAHMETPLGQDYLAYVIK